MNNNKESNKTLSYVLIIWYYHQYKKNLMSYFFWIHPTVSVPGYSGQLCGKCPFLPCHACGCELCTYQLSPAHFHWSVLGHIKFDHCSVNVCRKQNFDFNTVNYAITCRKEMLIFDTSKLTCEYTAGNKILISTKVTILTLIF